MKEEISDVKEEEEGLKKMIEMGRDYQKRKKELEGEYGMLRKRLKADVARDEVMRGEIEIMKEEYDKLIGGIKEEMIPTFKRLRTEDKAEFILNLEQEELSEIIEVVIKKKLLEEIAKNLLRAFR